MKFRGRMLSLLLALVMVLAYMPVMSYAATKTPKKVEYTIGDETPSGYIGSKWFNIETENAKITITYSDDSVEEYTYHDFEQWNEDTEEYENEDERGFYLNGKLGGKVLNSEKYWSAIDSPLKAGENVGRLVMEVSNEDTIESTPFTVLGIKDESIESVSYTQADPWNGKLDFNWNRVEYDTLDNIVGDTITVTKKEEVWDDEKEEYTNVSVTRTYTAEVDSEDDVWYRFVDDEGDSLYPDFADDQETNPWKPGETHEVAIYLDGVEAPQKAIVNVENVVYPEKMEFIPAAGFTTEDDVFIGQEFLYEGVFFWGGNKFVMSFSDGTTQEYIYIDNNNYTGFYANGEPSEENYLGVWGNVEPLKKGTQEVTLYGNYYDPALDYEFSVPCTTTVTAKKYNAWADSKAYTYTGKPISSKVFKVVLRDSVNRKLSSSEYSFKLPKNKNVGFYEYLIKIKDSDNYFTPVWGEYTINPKRVAAKKLTAGKKKATITWAKWSRTDQKQITGFKVEYSLYKNFKKSTTKTVAKKSASSYVIKSLKSKKVYYVRVYAYKTCKTPWGEKITLRSLKPSKVLKVKVK